MNIILTGASRGIGYQTALELCKLNIDRLLLISRNEDKLRELVEKCKKINEKVIVEIAAEDISVLSHKKNFASNIGWKSCDVIINNAGLLAKSPFVQLSDKEVQSVFEVNFFSPARLIKNNMELLMKSTNAHVLNISSMAGYQGSSKFPELNFYGASKAALASLTESLAEEYKDTNINFNCLALGAVQTEMLEEAFPGYKAPINPTKMGKYIADFALNGHNFFNGKILPVTLTTP